MGIFVHAVRWDRRGTATGIVALSLECVGAALVFFDLYGPLLKLA